MKSMRVAGVMSGTSLDGIDVAVVDLRGSGFKTKFEVVGFGGTPYPQDVREALLAVSNTTAHTGQVARLSFLLGELYADAIRAVCSEAKVQTLDLVGCHGQTIFHEGAPVKFLGKKIASTFQIGESAVIAERLGVPVISNFRERDVAAGGRGAPLVPYVDYLLFRHPKRYRVAVNIGGIANLSLIPPGAAPESIVAFDTGPGNMVIDQIVEWFTGERYDIGGAIAARGVANETVLKDLLRDPYYRRKAPKTAGREEYGKEFVARLLATGLGFEDLVATATALTARTIARAIPQDADDVIVAGGGVHNATLMAQIPKARPSSEFGIHPDAKEAIAFAILAYESWNGRPGNLPSATGARHAVTLGKLTR
jgi:anhydro-N-acetylmuramic acid kinase